MQKPYTKLLSSKRCRLSEVNDRKLVIESESDRSRIVFSAPFRRLQQKAQVFSLESNAAVRSRLTHSLEVAQIGRFLADQIVVKLLEQEELDEEEARAFITFVEVACLMHDLGNPPFGHFGEAAIANWFQSHGQLCITNALGLKEKNKNPPKDIQIALADFLEFDGNCQGLRIAGLLQWKDDEHGLNLTYTSLASYLKYIRSPSLDPTKEKDKLFRKKAGFFNSERPLVEAIWAHFGYNKKAPQRFPLAYVMEAADDIAYCISDLEDSIEKELLSGKEVFPKLLSDWKEKITSNKKMKGPHVEAITDMLAIAAHSNKSSSATFTDFRTKFSRLLTEIGCANFCTNHADIIAGKAGSLIGENSPEGYALEILKSYCRTHVYQHVSVQRTELTGLTAISGILDHFGILLNCSTQRFSASLDKDTKDAEGKPIVIERKLLALFPAKHITAYKHACEAISKNRKMSSRQKSIAEWANRAHLMTDFISGMTDDFALATYQMLSGIKVDSI